MHEHEHEHEYEHEHEHEHGNGDGKGENLFVREGPFKGCGKPEFAESTLQFSSPPPFFFLSPQIVLVLNEMVLVLVLENATGETGRFFRARARWGVVVCCVVVANTRSIACALQLLLFALGSGFRRILPSLTQHRRTVSIRPASALDGRPGFCAGRFGTPRWGLESISFWYSMSSRPWPLRFAAARLNEKTHDLRGGEQTSANCRCGQRSRGGIRRCPGSNRGVVLFPTIGGLPSTASH